MKPEHLGDGAYVSETAEGLVLTANHHLEELATDRVYLDTRGVTNLKRYIESGMRASDGIAADHYIAALESRIRELEAKLAAAVG